MHKCKKFSFGFTLVEVLVVLAITALVAAIIVQTIAAILRGVLKTGSILEVKQNGSFTLAVMEQMIRNSVSTPICLFPTPGILVSGVQITNPDTVTFACLYDGSKYFIASGSGVIPTYAPVTSSIVQVVPGSCSFTCPTGTPSRVTIQYSLSSYRPQVTPRPQDTVTEQFSTSITLRSY